MKEARRNTLVGVFVLVGLLCLGTLIVLFGQGFFVGLPKDAYYVNIRFDTASGIRQDTLVTIAGREVGRVRTVDFVDPNRFDRGVNVLVQFQKGYRLRVGAYAQTSEPGLGMGRPPIEIMPGAPDGPFLPSGEIIAGRMSKMVETLIPPAIVSTFDKTATQIGETAAALTPVLEDLHNLLQARTPQLVDQPGGPPGNLSSAAARLDALLQHFNNVLGSPETQSHLQATISNLHTMSEDGKVITSDARAAAADFKQIASDGKALVNQAQAAVTNADQNIERVSRSLLANLDQSSGFLTEMNRMAQGANRGEGTLGQLITDSRLYESMVLTFRRLAETVEEFKVLVKDWQQGKIKVAL